MGDVADAMQRLLYRWLMNGGAPVNELRRWLGCGFVRLVSQVRCFRRDLILMELVAWLKGKESEAQSLYT